MYSIHVHIIVVMNKSVDEEIVKKSESFHMQWRNGGRIMQAHIYEFPSSIPLMDQIWMKCKPLLSLNVNVSDTADKLATDSLGRLIGCRLVLTFLAMEM